MANFQRIRTKAEKKRIRKKERNSNSTKKHQDFSDRRALRYSKLGRITEVRVEKLLTKKKEMEELIDFERYETNSSEDSDGHDFWVSALIDGEVISASFGTTISMRCQQKHQMKHPNVPSILIPPEMNDERIWYRIIQILKETKKTRA